MFEPYNLLAPIEDVRTSSTLSFIQNMVPSRTYGYFHYFLLLHFRVKVEKIKMKRNTMMFLQSLFGFEFCITRGWEKNNF